MVEKLASEPYLEASHYSIDKIQWRLGFTVKWALKDGIRQTAQYAISEATP